MSTRDNSLAEQLAHAEKKAATVVPLGGARWLLIALFIGYIVALFLPHSGDVTGLDVLFRSTNAMEHSTSTLEILYTWAVLIAQLIGLAVAFTANRQLAQIGVVVSMAASISAMLAVWKRQARGPEDLGSGPSWGLMLGAFVAFALLLTLILLTIQRTDEQWELNELRKQHTPQSELALAQMEVLEAKRRGNVDPFLDDRRDRARRRRERMLGNRPDAADGPGDAAGN